MLEPKLLELNSSKVSEVMVDLQNPIFLNRKDIKRLGIDVSNVTLLRWESDGRFVKRVRLGGTRVAWPAGQIQQWCQDRIDERSRHHYADAKL